MTGDEGLYRNLARAYVGNALFQRAPDILCDAWQYAYLSFTGHAEFLTVSTDAGGASFTYLFDYAGSRVVGVWGMPIYSRHTRDASRMAGAPLGAAQGSGFHRGHLIAHSIGGGTDINLVPQLGSVNIGAYRVLERAARRLAQGGVQSLYAVRVLYTDPTSQMPNQLEQVLMEANGTYRYALHHNTP